MEKVPFRSIPDLLRHQATRLDAKLAVKFRKQGNWVTLSYSQFFNRALMVARGLRKLGVRPGDKIAILSENRAGWIIADMGILCAGAVTVPVYPTNTPEQIEYTLNHSDARIVFISGKWQYRKLLKIRDAIPMVQLVVSFERFLGEPSLPLTTFYQLSEIDDPISDEERDELSAVIDSIEPESLMTVIYTSGTTGIPKGVMLSHRNILFDVFATIRKAAVLEDGEVFLSFLPLSHVLERCTGYYLPVAQGAMIAFADSIEKIAENMLEIQPTVMVCVPRLFEKIHSRIYEHVHQLSLYKRKLFRSVLAIGRSYVYARYIEKKVPLWLALRHAVADRLVFSKLRRRFGDNLKFCSSGGAPLDREINEFFWSIGVPILEGYGLTETSPVLCNNTFEALRFGSVGTPLEETEFRVDDDGELLVRGPQVMIGYYKDETATREVLSDGWLRTGDIGRLEGEFVVISDRKKDLIVTAGGKNIAPQPIENLLKRDKYISQAYVYGDKRPYLTALLVPTLEKLLEFAQEKRIVYTDLEELVVHEPVLELYRQRVEAVNAELAHYETIKNFVLLPRDFTLEAGELTPTLKVKRRVISDRYKDKIERMYTVAEN
ncbi:long-chain fatty acid--CoA ligase [Geomonas sp. Red69]|uniref:Long-chain fatty acid--CoA ligase n=1 Tax=Geomonas diazotrophica TaxID=2843197 RepID=A0ABX8JN17_9BACT|nr:MULTISPECIES: long-chain fatty acid--CoA ligase [Geomonas]MBU5637528.1 long-chain fatty acid--CoA ligase [Geomonas diazotrophica]QWV99351.1 long-chain fatty acid--CoA ligase [Geomonas nitrogeniifigens]QXE88518.1 long-chain fatty acid--CoA ligase [Geomonas nitrogeniifigens]